MTPKEAFKDITHELRQRHMDMYADCDRESVSLIIDEMNKRETIVDQALTELEALKRYPTSDEVCKALSEYLEEEVHYEDKEFFGEDGTICYIWEYPTGEVNLAINYDILSSRLLILIGRFYEGLEK